VLFSIITDLFRYHYMSGWLKAVWIIFLFVIPFLSAMIYVIVRNDGMTQRSMAAAHRRMNAQGVYVRDDGGQSSAQQISAAKGLLDSGAINEEEFRALKAKTIMQ
jgi:hypothetical protein